MAAGADKTLLEFGLRRAQVRAKSSTRERFRWPSRRLSDPSGITCKRPGLSGTLWRQVDTGRNDSWAAACEFFRWSNGAVVAEWFLYRRKKFEACVFVESCRDGRAVKFFWNKSAAAAAVSTAAARVRTELCPPLATRTSADSMVPATCLQGSSLASTSAARTPTLSFSPTHRSSRYVMNDAARRRSIAVLIDRGRHVAPPIVSGFCPADRKLPRFLERLRTPE